MEYPLPSNILEDSDIHRTISRYELLHCGSLFGRLSIIEAAFLPLIRNWVYLYLSSDYNFNIPFFCKASSALAEVPFYLPEAIACLMNVMQSGRITRTCRSPVAVLKAEEVDMLKDGGRYGLAISGDYIVTKASGEMVMPYLNEDAITPSVGDGADTSIPKLLHFNGNSLFQGINSYVEGIIGLQVDFINLSRFSIACAKIALSLEECDSLRKYDAICYFNVYNTFSSAINMYCISRDKLSVEIAHGAFFSLYAHEHTEPRLFVPRVIFDPYYTLVRVFGRFNNMPFFVDSKFFNVAKSKESTSVTNRVHPKNRNYFLLRDRYSINKVSRSFFDTGVNELFLFDNTRCKYIHELPALLTTFFKSNIENGLWTGSKIFIVGHPLLGASLAIQSLCKQCGICYEIISGFDDVQQRILKDRTEANRPGLITFTESAVWRDILSLDNYVHLHIGKTPLGKYLLYTDRDH